MVPCPVVQSIGLWTEVSQVQFPVKGHPPKKILKHACDKKWHKWSTVSWVFWVPLSATQPCFSQRLLSLFPPWLCIFPVPLSDLQPKGSKVQSRTRGFVCREFTLLRYYKDKHTKKGLLLPMINFSFLTDVAALLIVQWHLERLGEGSCFHDTPGHCLGDLGVGECHHSSGFRCLGVGDRSLLNSYLWMLRTWDLVSFCPNTHENSGNQLNDLQGTDRMLAFPSQLIFLMVEKHWETMTCFGRSLPNSLQITRVKCPWITGSTSGKWLKE